MILNFSSYSERSEYSADVVVVGTGAGGAVVGAELAEAGMDVLMVEEGSWHPTSSFNPYLSESVPRLYRDAGATIIVGSPPIPYLEGRCVGGSTVINGGMSWRTPEPILDEWVRLTGDDSLSSQGLESEFERVEERVSVKHQHPVSVGDDSRLMAAGARKMGWSYNVNLRNQATCVGTNNCVMGCPTGAKRSTLVSYMPRAMSAGATCLTELKIDKLLIENGRCVGVEGYSCDPQTRRPSKRIKIHAKAVVVAGGAVQTPYLLLRHRLGKQGGQLGNNFLCHPNVKLTVLYPFDVKAWQGVSQWTQITEFKDDEGIIMAENMIPPGAAAAHLFAHGREAWELMSRFNSMMVCGILAEDSTTGTVRRGLFGMPWVRYDLTPYDHERFLRNIKRLATLHFEMGADTILLPFSNFHVAHNADELAQIDVTQKSLSTLEPVTMHIMGTARMGSRASNSVVNPSGELWDLPGCYVADASVFPTAIGVNPQITIMALATRIAGRMVEQMGRIRRAA